MSSPQAVCLLFVALIVAFAHVGAASAATPLPGSCLTAASTLCANADTNAMRCLTKLAMRRDARVPSACAEAIMAGATVNPRRKQSRDQSLLRLLTEGGACAAGNSCATGSSQAQARCNDVLNGCSGCSQGVRPVGNGGFFSVTSGPNANGYACNNICCQNTNNAERACCSSWMSGGITGVYCLGGGTGCPV